MWLCDIYPFMLAVANSIVREIFQGEMFFRTLPTTLPQIFCKIIPNFKVTVKSIDSLIQNTIPRLKDLFKG